MILDRGQGVVCGGSSGVLVVDIVLVFEVLEAPAPIEISPGSSKGSCWARRGVLPSLRGSRGTHLHGTRDRGKFSSLLPSVSPDAGVKRLGSESGMISGDPVGEGEGKGLSIHLQDE